MCKNGMLTTIVHWNQHGQCADGHSSNPTLYKEGEMICSDWDNADFGFGELTPAQIKSMLRVAPACSAVPSMKTRHHPEMEYCVAGARKWMSKSGLTRG